MERRIRLPDGTFGPVEKVGTKETEAEKIARLEFEKQLLMASMMELSSLAAIQQQAIDEQNSAIMELSTIISITTGGSE